MDINNVLDTYPSLIARNSEEAEQLRLEWQQAKEVYEHKEAGFVLKMKAENSELKATEIKYFIASNDELYKERLNLVLLESTYRKKEVGMGSLEESLNAAKMLAKLKIAEMSANLNWTAGKKEDL